MIVTDKWKVNKMEQKKHMFSICLTYVCLASLYEEKQRDNETENIFYYGCII